MSDQTYQGLATYSPQACRVAKLGGQMIAINR